MPRYFFHTNGVASFRDRVGVELPDDDAAWSNAVRSIAELLRDIDGSMPARAELETVVTDDRDNTLITLRVIGERNASSDSTPPRTLD